MKLLVTGGAGVIGSALVRRPLASTGDPVVVDLLTYAGNRATWYRGNRALWESMRGPEWSAWYAAQYGSRLEQSTPA